MTLETHMLAAELHRRLLQRANEHPITPLGPEWWQDRMLDWASSDPDFRVKLLRFVDVLPTLKTPAAVGDHLRQYFRDAGEAPLRVGSELAGQPLFRPMVSGIVRRGVLAMAHRFIAGASPTEALPHLQALAERGTAYSVDLLGEATLSDVEALAYLGRYMAILQFLAEHRQAVSPRGERWVGVPPINLSVKLSALCARFEPAAPEYVTGVLLERLRPLLRAARRNGAFIHFDMEQYRYKRLIHQVFSHLLLDPEFRDWTDTGIVVQAYLRDAESDIEGLLTLAEHRGVPFTVRLVKGAYWDEERIIAIQNNWPIPVYGQKSETDASYERCVDLLLRAWPHLRPAFGTHNPASIAYAAASAEQASLEPRDFEFQMLYGMAEDLCAAVQAEGHRVRVYAPVGEVIPGMGYLVRRLLENSSNLAWFRSTRADRAPLAPAPAELPQQRQRPAAVPHRAAAEFRNSAPTRFFEAEPRRRMQAALERVRTSPRHLQPLLIGESQVTDRPVAEVRYPADPALIIGRVAQATRQDVELAVTRASAAFADWRDRPASERSAVLHHAAALLEQHRFELAALMVYESAKPWYEADGDVDEAIDYLRYYAAEAERLLRRRRMGDLPGEDNEYFYEARGVACIIAPWNFPLAIITGMTAAALATGNAAILKPSEQSPLIAASLVGLLREAGVPADIVHYLPGAGEEVGRALAEHPQVDIIAFTGSSAVGQELLQVAARVHPGQRGIKRVIAEMGGKNAIIIDDDADLDQALADTLVSAFGYAGQKCSACSRLIVLRPVYREVLDRLGSATLSLPVGPPHDPANFVPPVISAEAQQRILQAVESAKQTARLVAQGCVPAGNGYYVPPSVFADVSVDDPLACEEIFGPVLAVLEAPSFDRALELAMHSRYALTGGVFSRNPRNIEAAVRRFRVGNLYINRKVTGAMVGRQPFGGLAMSGYGEKAGSPEYLRQFVEPRVVTENTMRRGFAPEAAGS